MPKCESCHQIFALGNTKCTQCGAPPSFEIVDLAKQIPTLVRDGDVLPAVKLYKTHTGCTLIEAKRAVEHFQQTGNLDLPDYNIDESFELELVRLLDDGRKIDAIKFYRDRCGGDLADAKRFIDALATRHGIASAASGGCGVSVLLLIAAAVGAAIAYYLLR